VLRGSVPGVVRLIKPKVEKCCAGQCQDQVFEENLKKKKKMFRNCSTISFFHIFEKISFGVRGEVTTFSFATILPPEPNMCLFEEGQR
jgi:hypothetical protein